VIFLEKEWEKYVINKYDNRNLLEAMGKKDKKDYVNSAKWKLGRNLEAYLNYCLNTQPKLPFKQNLLE